LAEGYLAANRKTSRIATEPRVADGRTMSAKNLVMKLQDPDGFGAIGARLNI